MQLGYVDAAVIILYLIGMILIGVITRKKASDTSSYLVAGRNLGMVLFFPCMCAVILGGSGTIGSTQLGYTYGISGSSMIVMLGIGTIILGIVFCSKLVNLKILTIGQLLDIRFGDAAKIISSVVMSVYLIMLSVVQIIACGTIIHTMLGIDFKIAMLIGGGIGLLYSYLGGMVAITLTDFVQWLFMAIGVIVIFLPLAISHVGGIEALIDNSEPEFLSVTNIGVSTIFAYFIIFGCGILVEQSAWQRMFTAKNSKIAKKGVIGAGIFILIYGVTTTIIGMCAKIEIPGLDDPQLAFSRMAFETLPPIALGIVFAGALSAIMSTMSGPILSVSTLIVKDLLPYIKKTSSEKEQFKQSKVAMIVAGIFAMICALWIQDVVVAMDVAAGILVGGVFPAVATSLFWNRVTKKGAVTGMIAGTIVTIGGLAVMGISAISPLVCGALINGILVVVVSLFTPKEENGIEKRLKMMKTEGE